MSFLKDVPWLFGAWTMVLGGIKALLKPFKGKTKAEKLIESWLQSLKQDLTPAMITEIDSSVESLLALTGLPAWIRDLIGDVVASSTKTILALSDDDERVNVVVQAVAQAASNARVIEQIVPIPISVMNDSQGQSHTVGTYAAAQLIVRSDGLDVVKSALSSVV